MEPKALAVSALAAALKRSGSRSKTAQRMLGLQVARADPQVAVEALAEALLFEGIGAGEIPRAAGTRTKELADRAEASIIESARRYHEAGGVLLAKGHIERLHLIAEMAKQWLATFSPTLAPEVDLAATKTEEEINYRLALVAQLVGLHLLDASGRLQAVDLSLAAKHRPQALSYLSSLSSDPFDVDICVSDLEGLCMRLSRVMFEAFQMTEAAAHAAVHGEELPDADDAS